MSDYQTEQKKRIRQRARKQRTRKQALLTGSLILLIYLVAVFGGRIFTNYRMEDKLRQARAEKVLKLQRIQELEQQKVDLNNPDYVKEIARKNLYYMNRNEVHIKITPNPSEKADKQRKHGT